MKLRIRAAAAAGLALGLGLAPPASNAESVCDSAAVLEYLPPLPRGCQRQRIQATGALSFGIVQSAGSHARHAWERQVITLYGERYMDWNKAACKKVFCVEATFAGSRRCTYSGFPCSTDAEAAAVEALNTQQVLPEEQHTNRELMAPEVKEMQQLLSKAGYRVHADGIFGDDTQRALTKWQRSKKLPDNGTATWETLETLRRHFAAGQTSSP